MSVNAAQSARRLKALYDHWKAQSESWGDVGSFLVATGPANTDEGNIEYHKTTAFQMRLFEYELPDTIMLMTSTEVHVVTTAKKIEFLKPVAEPWLAEAGVTLKTHEKPKGSNGKDQIVALLAAAKAAGPRLGYLAKETVNGDFCQLLDTLMKETDLVTVDVTASLAMAMAPKDKEELLDMKRASLLCTQVLEKCLVSKIEDVVDNAKKITHEALATLAEAAALDPSKPPVEVKLKAENVTVAYPFVVQSGGVYDHNVGAQPTPKNIHYDPLGVIICRLGLKYKSYCGSIGRTYLINPTPPMAAAYEALLKAHQAAIAAATDGAKLSSIYEAARASLTASDEKLVEHLMKNGGHVIGLELREAKMVITAKNERCVEAGTVLHITTGLERLVNEAGQKDKEKNYALFLGDCIVVTKAAPDLITKAKVQPSDVSYEISAEESEVEEVVVEAPRRAKGASAVLQGKTRGEGSTREQDDKEAVRKQKQEEMAKRKNQETLERLTEQSTRVNQAASTSQVAKDFNAFRSVTEIAAQRSREGMVMVDEQHESILLPIYGTLVPFHVGTLKNVQVIQGELNHSVIRITFNTPGQGFGGTGWAPAVANPDCTFLREISFRSADTRHAQQIAIDIKNLRATFKQRETDRVQRLSLVTQEKLRTRPSSKGRMHTLREVTVRPSAVRAGKGRKVPGTLECHDNGFRYTNTREEHIDIIFANIKHAFFQPGGKRDTITLIHFHLHHPIMIGKKKTTDVQFSTEVVEAVQNIDGNRRSMHDPEELEDEQRERERRNRINADYSRFTKAVQEQWEKEQADLDLDFDVPFPELGFQGVPHKTQSWVLPTVHCLVELIETPFFVISLKDIEVVNLERVGFGLKNFDMAIVFKDFGREVHKITSIDMKYLDSLKEWMTRIKIKYYESKMNLNWKPILKTILDDPEQFVQTGGWDFLNLDQTDSDEEAEEEEEAYEPTDDSDDSDDDDDSDDSDAADSDDEGSGSGGSDDSEEEEGKDWDELEKEAMEDDADVSDDDEEDERQKKKRKAGGGGGGGSGKGGPPPKKGKIAPPPPAGKKSGKK